MRRPPSMIASIAALALLAACGSSASSRDVAVSGPAAPRSGTAASDGSPALGYEFIAAGYAPVHIETAATPPSMPTDLHVDAFRDQTGGLVVIRSEEASGIPTGVQEATSGAAGQQAVVAKDGISYTVTQSYTTDAATIQRNIAAALSTLKPGTDTTAAALAALPGYRLTSSTADGPAVTSGYSVNYSNGASVVTLAVYPTTAGTELAVTDAVASNSYLQRSGRSEWIVENGATGELPQIHWIEGDRLLVLTGYRGDPASVGDVVQATTTDPVEHTRAAIDAAIESTPSGGSTQIGSYKVAKHAGVNSGQHAVCVSASDGQSSCSEFFAVDSLASIQLGTTWFIVAVVPTENPTTKFRTVPPLNFDSATSDGWTYSLRAVPSGTDEVTVFYSTDGVPEFNAVEHRP